ncbi:MAG: site-specific DNA-methyltransferase [Propionibacteriaceae bacterium]|nr:site-specific DNA-methyltransferase [Propionibacteriaceae bacterium]
MFDVVHRALRGDNLAVLRRLRGRGERFDTIYADPPWNSHLPGLGYDDNYGSHQDWAKFMKPRLTLARDLLEPTGVLLCSIGPEEHHYLKVLLDGVMGERNFISDVTWHGAARGNARYVSDGAEYLLIYARDLAALRDSGVRWTMPKDRVEECLHVARQCLQDAQGDTVKASAAYRAWMRTQKLGWGYRNYDTVDADGRPYYAQPITKPTGDGPRYDIPHPRNGRPCRLPKHGWRLTEETFGQLLTDGRVLFGPDHTTAPRLKSYLESQGCVTPPSVFAVSRRGGARRLEQLGLGGAIKYPKDPAALGAWIGAVTPNDGRVLDAFAGSGSTGEAVVRLNQADGGTRQVTLIEDALFDTVLVPRMTAVLSGVRPDGLPTGLDEVTGQVLRVS